ncbi:hypothetical protein [Kitasatospora sp. GAS1066B]|uniref:hypothetical protein n=1 Tax=Kitasatospora sp. GAS1066B TaxID=3156271 RepID=UPI0035128986
MSDVRPEDVERLAVLVRDLAEVRRAARQSAAQEPSQVPKLLGENIDAFAAYIAGAARLGAELSEGPRRGVPSPGEMWGQEFTATRDAAILLRLTELLSGAGRLRPTGHRHRRRRRLGTRPAQPLSGPAAPSPHRRPLGAPRPVLPLPGARSCPVAST